MFSFDSVFQALCWWEAKDKTETNNALKKKKKKYCGAAGERNMYEMLWSFALFPVSLVPMSFLRNEAVFSSPIQQIFFFASFIRI